MDSIRQIRQKYDQFAAWLEEMIGTEAAEELPLYIASCWMRIWSANKLYSPEYKEALAAVAGQTPTVVQVMTALSCCGEPQRTVEVPKLFRRLLGRSGGRTQQNVQTFADRLAQLLTDGACCNGDFTLEEADAIQEILNGLRRAARKEGMDFDLPKPTRPVTALESSRYLKKAAEGEPKERDARDTEERSGAPVPKKETKSRSNTSAPERVTEEGGLDALLSELDSLVGLQTVKQDVHSLTNFVRVTKLRQNRGMKVPTISYHLVFTGNPGTGKTTVARLVARIYHAMGILPQGQLVEADRSSLVAGYLGQTAIKTQEVIKRALGGVLFIDEAYALINEKNDSYGKEAIETLLKAMEDHRDELVVIVAGYEGLMQEFIRSNPGLSSRFSKYFNFPDYEGRDMFQIFLRFCSINDYLVQPQCEPFLQEKFDALYQQRSEHFGNARMVRNLFEKAVSHQADRLARREGVSDLELMTLTAEDLEKAWKEI